MDPNLQLAEILRKRTISDQSVVSSASFDSIEASSLETSVEESPGNSFRSFLSQETLAQPSSVASASALEFQKALYFLWMANSHLNRGFQLHQISQAIIESRPEVNIPISKKDSQSYLVTNSAPKQESLDLRMSSPHETSSDELEQLHTVCDRTLQQLSTANQIAPCSTNYKCANCNTDKTTLWRRDRTVNQF